MLLRINICGIFVYGLNGVVMNLKGGFEDYKISTKNMPLKLAGFILSFAIALTAIGFGVSKLIEKDEGYYDISESAVDDATGYGNGFELHYYLQGTNSEIKEQNRQLESIYSTTLERAYKLLDPINEYDNYINIAHINNHPGETIEVSDELAYVLADALSKTGAGEGYNMFAGPLYAHWNSILILEEESEFDPVNNSEEKERISSLASVLGSIDNFSLEVNDNKVTFNPSASVTTFLKDNEESQAIIDLNLLKDSYIIKIVADELEKAGYTNGYLVSESGIVHNLSAHSNGEFAFYSVDKTEYVNSTDIEKTAAVQMSGVYTVTAGASFSGFRMFAILDNEDLYHIVETEDGDIFRSPFANTKPEGTYNYYDSLYAVSEDGDIVKATYELVKIINNGDMPVKTVIEGENGLDIFLFLKK